MTELRSSTFLFLVLAHVLTDYPLQTNAIVRWKKEKGLIGDLLHAGVFVVASLGLMTVWPPAPELFRPVLGAVLFVFFVHAVLDYWRVWYVKRDPGLDTLWTFLGDQALHGVSMVAAIGLFGVPWTAFDGARQTLLLLNGALLSAFGATVVLFYVRHLVSDSHRYEMFSPYRRFFLALFAMVYFFLFYPGGSGMLAWFPYLLLVNLAFNRLIVRRFSGEGEALFDTLGEVAFVALVAAVTRQLA